MKTFGQTRLYRLWTILEETVVVGLLVGMTAIVLLQVIGRYILTNPYIWTEEVTRLLLIWLTFLGGAAVTRRGLHIAVDMFVRPLPGRPRVVLAGVCELITAGSFLYLGWLGNVLAMKLGTLPLAATRWPMSVMVWPAVAGCCLIGIYAALRGLGHLTAVGRGDDLTAIRETLDEGIRS